MSYDDYGDDPPDDWDDGATTDVGSGPQGSGATVPRWAPGVQMPEGWRGYQGGTFLRDYGRRVPALWGDGERALWVEGESLMIAGGPGLGKTTLAGLVLHAQLLGGDVLGLPVCQLKPGERVLYLAMDRPRQIARSLARQFTTAADHATLDASVVVRPGPPIADLAMRPELLAFMADRYGASVVYLDSIKDGAVGLSRDEVGAGYNRARQRLIVEGVQLCELHHSTKRNGDGGAPSSIADVYGATWLTSGTGSVILLTGEPGDPIVGFRHVRQPSEEVGPFRLAHDEKAGLMTIWHEVDLVKLAEASRQNGLTAKGAAVALFDTERPDRSMVDKARRRLDQLVVTGDLVRTDGTAGGTAGGTPTTWFPAYDPDQPDGYDEGSDA